MKSKDTKKREPHIEIVCVFQFGGALEGVINSHKLEGSLERTV